MALTSKLSAIADSIRSKTGKSASMTLDEMPSEIESISGGGGEQPQLNSPTINIAENNLIITNPSSNGSFVEYFGGYVNGVYSGMDVPSSTPVVNLSALGLPSGVYSISASCKGTNFQESDLSNVATYRTPITVHFYDGTTEMTGSPVSIGYGQTLQDAITKGGIESTKSGYSFKNWCTDSSLEEVISVDTELTSDTNIYGKWESTPEYIYIKYIPDNASYKTPYLKYAIEGVFEVDWGDGSATQQITGTSTSNYQAKSHSYSAIGTYEIIIRPISAGAKFKFVTAGTSGSYKNHIGLLSYTNSFSYSSNYTTSDKRYNGRIKEIKVFNMDVEFDEYAFADSGYAVGALGDYQVYEFKNSMTSVQNYLFSNGKQIMTIDLPESVASIGKWAFNTVYLKEFRIPQNVTNIGAGAFASNSYMQKLHFKPTTPPVLDLSGTNPFSSLPTSCIIYVPRGSLSAYTSAEGYPSDSSYLYLEE